MISVGDPHVEADDYVHWFPRTCCSEHAKFDKRIVGLFKLEWQGDCLIGLCSNTYIIPRSKVAKTSTFQIAAYQILRRAKKLKSILKLSQNRKERILKQNLALMVSVNEGSKLVSQHLGMYSYLKSQVQQQTLASGHMRMVFLPMNRNVVAFRIYIVKERCSRMA